MTVRFSRRRRCKYDAIFNWLSYEKSHDNHNGQSGRSEQRKTPQSSNEKKRQRENKQTDSRAGNIVHPTDGDTSFLEQLQGVVKSK